MKYIYGFCMAVGLFLAIGAAGGSDCGSLTLAQAALYGVGGMVITLIGMFGLNSLGESENE